MNQFALPFVLLFVAIAAGAYSRLLQDDLNRAVHRRQRKPGTSFEPDVDPEEEGDSERFLEGLRTLEAATLPPHLKRRLRLYRATQVITWVAIAGIFLAGPVADYLRGG